MRLTVRVWDWKMRCGSIRGMLSVGAVCCMGRSVHVPYKPSTLAVASRSLHRPSLFLSARARAAETMVVVNIRSYPLPRYRGDQLGDTISYSYRAPFNPHNTQ